MTNATSTATQTTAPANAAPAAPRNAAEFLQKLYVEQCEWNKKYYKTTNDKLLDLLAKSLQARSMLADSIAQRKEFLALFNSIEEIASEKPLTLTSRVVRFVFRITGNRASAYARVLDIALEEKIKPAALPDWVRRNGGIEEVRRNYQSGQSPKDLRERLEAEAEKSLTATQAICVIADLPQALHASPDHTFPYTVALIRHDKTTGSGEVVWAASNETLIRQFLSHQGKAIAEAAVGKATAATLAAQLEADDAAIDTALNSTTAVPVATAA
jgi:hypothetical protein